MGRRLYEEAPEFLAFGEKYEHFLIIPDSGSRLLEMESWCEKHVGVEETDWQFLLLGVWAFKNLEDAVAFKLQWM